MMSSRSHFIVGTGGSVVVGFRSVKSESGMSELSRSVFGEVHVWVPWFRRSRVVPACSAGSTAHDALEIPLYRRHRGICCCWISVCIIGIRHVPPIPFGFWRSIGMGALVPQVESGPSIVCWEHGS